MSSGRCTRRCRARRRPACSRPSGSSVRNLTFAGVAAQLQADLVDLAKPDAPIGSPLRDESAVGVDR